MDETYCEQESFLNRLIEDQVLVNVFLVNGIRLVGTIHSYDQKIVLLSCGNGRQVIFKHSVSTIQISENTPPGNSIVPTRGAARAEHRGYARRRPHA